METRFCDNVFRICRSGTLLAGFPFLLVCMLTGGSAYAWTQIAAGGAHTCGITEEATVHCWGEGRFGQLGDGAEHARARPVQVPTLQNAVELALGENHSCVRTADGHVHCFGRNHRGQLGDGSVRDQSLPVRVEWLEDAVALAAGAHHNCALRKSGNVVCWGDNRYRQLATPSRLPFHRRPVALPRVRDVVQIQAGLAHTCILKQSGKVFCAGGNFAGQLAAQSSYPSSKLRQVVGPSNVVEIGAGLLHTCTRDVKGDVHCWGGHFKTQSERLKQEVISSASALVVGGHLSCGVHEMELRCIDDDKTNISSSFSLQVSTKPKPSVAGNTESTVDALSPSSLRAGTHHVCGLSAGSAYCLGKNSAGQLADGTRGGLGTSTPLFVRAIESTASLDFQSGLYCTRGKSGKQCWGTPTTDALSTSFCRRGDENIIECRSEGTWKTVSDGKKVRQVVGGDRFGCWLDTPGNVYCLGDSIQGELGNGALQAQSPLPLWVPGLKQVTQVVSGKDFACALEVQGQVKCWGAGLLGQLGTGRYRSSPDPVAVAGLLNVEELSAGRAHICARRQNGHVFCWGELFSGPEAMPRKMDVDARIIQLVSSDASTCARSADDGVYCWGRGHRGELGQDNPMYRDRWTPVVGLSSP